MPKEIVDAINREVIKATTENLLIAKQIEQDAIEVRAMTPAEVTQFSQSEIDRWAPLIKRIMATKAQ
jgi:tripartite-type tricarboxylate transporter receptor subunit TctC